MDSCTTVATTPSPRQQQQQQLTPPHRRSSPSLSPLSSSSREQGRYSPTAASSPPSFHHSQPGRQRHTMRFWSCCTSDESNEKRATATTTTMSNHHTMLEEACESRVSMKCRCKRATALIAACGIAAIVALVGNMTLILFLGQRHAVILADRFYFDGSAEAEALATDEPARPMRLALKTEPLRRATVSVFAATPFDSKQEQQQQHHATTTLETNRSSFSTTQEVASDDDSTEDFEFIDESNVTYLEQPLLAVPETLNIARMPRVLPVPPKKRQRRRRRRVKRPPLTLPQPLSESLAPNATFSACLLIKDDNDILAEWLAYHYYSLNLRHLIVAVDPSSSESPRDVFATWRLDSELSIVEWNDEDFMPPTFLQTGRAPLEYVAMETDLKSASSQSATAIAATTTNKQLSADSVLDISNHRYRQRVFLAQCMKELRATGHTWVMHIDTDEYVVPSKLLRQVRPDDIAIPPMNRPGAVLQLIQHVTQKDSALVNYPCISMLRVLFGSIERRDMTLDDNDAIPAPYSPQQFETLRWRYHALPHQLELNGNPKVILDVRAIPERYFTTGKSLDSDVVYSIHRPVRDYCLKSSDAVFSNYRKQPIAVNHYLGSWERYAKRIDKRRSRDIYNSKANVDQGKDDDYMRPWLQGFVDTMGPAVAARLLLDEANKEVLAQVSLQ